MRSGIDRQGAKDAKFNLGVLGVLVVQLCLSACPRLPEPEPRARAHVRSIERTGEALRARLAVERGGETVTVAAIDWEISLPGGPPLLRGRSTSLELTIALPAVLAPQLAAARRVRLRGAVHLREGRAAAVFDHTAQLR